MSIKNFSPFGPAVLPAIGNIYMHILFYYIDHWWEFWLRDTDVLIMLSITIYIYLLKINIRSKHEFFRLPDIVVFRLVAAIYMIIRKNMYRENLSTLKNDLVF